MGVGGVRRIEVTERERRVFGGTEFGAVGPYERLHGTIFGELDPAHPLNVGIVNLVYDVSNRGNQPIMPRLNGAPDGGHPSTPATAF